jgi:hypothetical protein
VLSLMQAESVYHDIYFLALTIDRHQSTQVERGRPEFGQYNKYHVKSRHGLKSVIQNP